MVDMFSDQQLEQKINTWLDTQEALNITEQMPIIFEGVTGGVARFEIDEKLIKLYICSSDGSPFEVQTTSQNSKIQLFVQKVNEKFSMKELPKLEDGLKFMMRTFSQTVLGIMINQISPKVHLDADQDMNYDMNDDGCDNWGDNDMQDALMQEPPNNDDEEDDAVDWGLDGDDDEANEYTKQIQNNIDQDKLNEIKQLGVSDMSGMMAGVLNFKSVRIFEQSKFYKDCQEALQYLQEHQEKIEGWLNLVVTKEFLNIRVEIDLNYINLHPSNVTMLGWKIEEPLIIVLDLQEPKLLNTSDQDLDELDFKEMWNQGMLQFQSLNAASPQNFGCQDYMREVFKTFIAENLNSDKKKMNFQEESKAQITQVVKKKGKSFWKKMFGQNKVDDEKLAQLINMGYDVNIANKCLLDCNNDIEKAIDMINDLDQNNQDLDLPRLNKQISKDYSIKNLPHTKNQIIRMMLYICDRLDKSTQYCILCHTKLMNDSIKLRACTSEHCEFIFEENFGGTIFPELKFNQHEAFLNISLAAKALFSGRAGSVFEPFPTFFLKDNELRTKRGNLDVIQRARLAGEQANKSKMVNEANKDLQKMTDLFQKIPPYAKLMQDINSEQELRQKLNTLYNDEKQAYTAYKLLSYILATNRSTFVKLTNQNCVDLNIGITNQLPNANTNNVNDNFDQYLIIPQDQEKERIFRQRKRTHGSVFCWHGSSTENWYSILRNGLRNVSNTSLMTAGAAYGAGIYASSQFQTSYGYTCRYTAGNKHWPHANQWIGNYSIIAVCEIIKKQGYDKNSNYGIAVIPDEDDIIIRYIFMIKNQGMYNIPNIDTMKVDFEKHYYSQLKFINHQLETQRQERIQNAYNKFEERRMKQQEEQKKIQESTYAKIQKAEEEELELQFKQMAEKFTGKGSMLSTQRISKDYVGLMKSSEFKDKLKVEFFKNNMYIWKVSFDLIKYEVSNDLKNDFKQLATKIGEDKALLQYEIIFSDKYPIDPPFVRVVFPRFAFRTGHVTVGGSICIESLTPSGWSSARSLESYFVEIVSLINAGNARLDLNSLQPYSLQEAKDAFNRVARDHGWLK